MDIADEEVYWGMNRNQLLDFYFNYKPYLESINTNVDLTAGVHLYQEFFVLSQQRVSNQNVEDYWALNPISIDRNALESYFARASFDIDDKYLISGSYRMDGSSRFSKDNRWSSFPAVSVGWKINNEDFLKDSEILSELKLRAGYGVTREIRKLEATTVISGYILQVKEEPATSLEINFIPLFVPKNMIKT